MTNLTRALRDGTCWWSRVTLLFLASLRAGAITLLAIRLSLPALVVGLRAPGLPINSMTLTHRLPHRVGGVAVVALPLMISVLCYYLLPGSHGVSQADEPALAAAPLLAAVAARPAAPLHRARCGERGAGGGGRVDGRSWGRRACPRSTRAPASSAR